MSDKKQARRQRRRRADGVFASPEAKRSAEAAASVLGIPVGEVLGYGQPSGKKGLWRVADVGKASFAARQHLENIAPAAPVKPLWQRLADRAAAVMPQRLESLRPAAVSEETEAEAEAAPRPNLWTRFTGWMWREWDKLPDRRLPLPSRPAWLRMPAWRPQFPRPNLVGAADRLEVWLEGENTRQAVMRTIFVGVAVGLVLVLVAMLVFAGIGVTVGLLSSSPVPAPLPTQVVAAVSTATPVPPAAVATFTPVPPTPEPLVFVTTDLPYGVVGSEYEGTIVATGKGATNFWGSPVHIPGLHFDWNNGALAGVPTLPGSFKISITAHDEAGQSLTTSFTLLVLSPPPAEPEKPVEQEEPSPPPPPPPTPAAPVTTTAAVTGHIGNGAGLEVVLFAGSDIVASTMIDTSGNYTFTGVPEGGYAVVVGKVTTTVVVGAGVGSVTVTEFHQVVRGDNLWNIYGQHSWSDFAEFADAHGLKHFVDGQGRLIVIIQPGQIFNLAEMSP